MEEYKGYRFPKSIIDFAVRYYYRYKLSLRDMSEIMLDRGVEVTLRNDTSLDLGMGHRHSLCQSNKET